MEFRARFPNAETENPFESGDSTDRELLVVILTPNNAGNFLIYLTGVDPVNCKVETYWAWGLILEAYEITGGVPIAIRRRLRDLFSQVASDPGRDISREIQHLAHDTQLLLPGLLHDAALRALSLEDGSKDTRPSLLAGWVGQYDPTALKTLQGVIRDYEKDPSFSSKHYAKVIPFIQSSGMGKSRLADELGKIYPMVNYVVRDPSRSSGFPDADGEIVDLLLLEFPTLDEMDLFGNREYSTVRMSAAWNHGTVIGLLQASFEHLTEWLDSRNPDLHDLEAVASWRHTDMAPAPETGNRSLKRAEFCEWVCSKAREIRGDLIKSKEWRRAFINNDEFESAIRQKFREPYFPGTDSLRTVAQELCMKIKKFRRQNENDPLLVFVLDEPSSLLKSFEGLYATFNRVISLLKHLPIWFLYLSTESTIERIFPAEISPPTKKYVTAPSPRRGEKDASSLARPSPFIAFPLDVGAHMRENLSPGVMPNLTHELLRRCAAMQLAVNQLTYDLYLPYYFGAEDEQFDPEKASGILVHINNQDAATSPQNILKEEFFPVDGQIPCKSAGECDRERDGPNFIFQGSKQPLLLLIMDLGVSINGSTSRVEVTRTNNDDLPVVWAIHSRGHDPWTFRCLAEMNCEQVSEQLFQATSPHLSNHDICALRNDRFAKLGRGYRYPELPTQDDSKSKKQARSASADEEDDQQGVKRRKVVGSPSCYQS
ncbi:hypothetical protein FQN50_008812 [Emmonsiellopsis sp. PD_5]|nr:hypothetical protein FQN50_008812 [Emmonsiellopsis sp. PD_5]